MFYLLLCAPLPACLMGIILMYVHGLSPLIWGQQLGVFGLALIICGFSQRVISKPYTGQTSSRWFTFFLLCICFSSLGGSPEEPQRWLYLGPFRLYTASIFLPSVFILLIDAQRRELFSELWQAVIYLLITMALILQPDTAQVTAFACTAVLSFAFMGFSWTRLITAVILAVCTAGSWMRPDPLAPVFTCGGCFRSGLANSPHFVWPFAIKSLFALYYIVLERQTPTSRIFQCGILLSLDGFLSCFYSNDPNANLRVWSWSHFGLFSYAQLCPSYTEFLCPKRS